MRFGKTKIEKEKVLSAEKPINIWDVNIDNIDILKLIEIKPSSKYLIACLRQLSRYVKTFKVKGGDEDKNNKLMSFNRNYEKLLEKHKAI